MSMMRGKSNLLLTVCIFSAIYTVSGKGIRAPPCSLRGLPLDTSASNPIILPTVPDNMAAGTIAWQWEYEGDPNTTTAVSSPDYKYLTARFNRAISSYVITANAVTNQFTRVEKRRVITRHISLYCKDAAQTRIRYYFITPVQDVTPPVFQLEEYTFNITPGWNPERPISEGQFVIVSDDAFELGEGTWNLTFEASQSDTLKIKGHKLWAQPGLEAYHYRLDLYIDENMILMSGDKIQLFISAKDQFSAGLARININVT